MMFPMVVMCYFPFTPPKIRKFAQTCIQHYVGICMYHAVVGIEQICGIEVHAYGRDVMKINSRENAIMICNHPTFFEFLMIFCFQAKYSTLTQIKVIPKSQTALVPYLGYVMQISMYIFLVRDWSQDHHTFLSILEYYRHHIQRYQILVFPEGTTLADYSIPRSDAYIKKNNMKPLAESHAPRTLGFIELFFALSRLDKLLPPFPLCVPIVGDGGMGCGIGQGSEMGCGGSNLDTIDTSPSSPTTPHQSTSESNLKCHPHYQSEEILTYLDCFSEIDAIYDFTVYYQNTRNVNSNILVLGGAPHHVHIRMKRWDVMEFLTQVMSIDIVHGANYFKDGESAVQNAQNIAKKMYDLHVHRGNPGGVVRGGGNRLGTPISPEGGLGQGGEGTNNRGRIDNDNNNSTTLSTQNQSQSTHFVSNHNQCELQHMDGKEEEECGATHNTNLANGPITTTSSTSKPTTTTTTTPTSPIPTWEKPFSLAAHGLQLSQRAIIEQQLSIWLTNLGYEKDGDLKRYYNKVETIAQQNPTQFTSKTSKFIPVDESTYFNNSPSYLWIHRGSVLLTVWVCVGGFVAAWWLPRFRKALFWYNFLTFMLLTVMRLPAHLIQLSCSKWYDNWTQGRDNEVKIMEDGMVGGMIDVDRVNNRIHYTENPRSSTQFDPTDMSNVIPQRWYRKKEIGMEQQRLDRVKFEREKKHKAEMAAMVDNILPQSLQPLEQPASPKVSSPRPPTLFHPPSPKHGVVGKGYGFQIEQYGPHIYSTGANWGIGHWIALVTPVVCIVWTGVVTRGFSG